MNNKIKKLYGKFNISEIEYCTWLYGNKEKAKEQMKIIHKLKENKYARDRNVDLQILKILGI